MVGLQQFAGVGLVAGETRIPRDDERRRGVGVTNDAVNGEDSSAGANGHARGETTGGERDGEVKTAVYRPESNDEWREQLREAGRRAYPNMDGDARTAGTSGGRDRELEALEWDLEDNDNDDKAEKQAGTIGNGGRGRADDDSNHARIWKCKKILRNHLEAVRALKVFENESGGHDVVSGGDDLVVKLWRKVFDPSQ